MKRPPAPPPRASWPASSAGRRPRPRAIWPSCQSWTSARPSSPWSLPRATTAWAANAPGFATATWPAHGARRWPPTWSSSTITFSLPIWPFANRAWPSCCPPPAPWCLTKRTSSTKPASSFWAASSATASCRISRVICSPPVCSTRAACKTGARWLAALKTPCAICGWPLAICLPARPAAMPACAGTLSRPKACLKQAGWPPWPACKPRWSPLPPLAKPCKTPPPTFPACSPAPSAWPGWPRTLPSPPRRMRPAGWKWAFTPCN